MNENKPTTEKSSLRWMVLVTVIIGTFLGRLDQTIVNLAIPKVIDDFGITVSAASWIATAYIIANAIFVPIWGKLGDTVGRKRIYILGFVGFIGGSILAGIAWNLDSMIVFRIIQAIAGSADYPTAMAILAVTFHDPKERAQALGIWSSAFAASAVFGPLIGGPLIDAFGWRSVFFLNVPVGLIGLYMALRYIKESVSERRTVKFDWLGASTLGAALAAVVLVLDQGSSWGWASSASMASYACAIVFGIAFYLIERHHSEPIMDLSLFKNSTFVGAILNNFIIFLAMMGSVFAVPIFAQTFLGLSATQAGLIFVPMGLCIPFFSRSLRQIFGEISYPMGHGGQQYRGGDMLLSPFVHRPPVDSPRSGHTPRANGFVHGREPAKIDRPRGEFGPPRSHRRRLIDPRLGAQHRRRLRHRHFRHAHQRVHGEQRPLYFKEQHAQRRNARRTCHIHRPHRT